ncbi:MAG: universal stress protein [Candidatus Ratteibacteria bacterium]|jgi:nucleotide-binding universal stress UspA family protein
MMRPRILLSVPDTPNFLICAKFAIVLTKHLNAQLTAVYVVNQKVVHDLLAEKIFVTSEAEAFTASLEEQGTIFLANISAMADEQNIPFKGSLVKGVVHHEVIKAVREIRADLLVMGKLKRTLSVKDILYDEGERIFREAPCAVVSVRDEAAVERLYNEL